MTKDKFSVLCEQVLVPRLNDMMAREMTDLHQALDVISRELIRIGKRLDQMALSTGRPTQKDAD